MVFFLTAQWVKNLSNACNAGDTRGTGSIPGLGRTPGEGDGNPLQYSCLENPTDSGAWWATVQISDQKYKTSNKTDQRYMKLPSSLGVELRISAEEESRWRRNRTERSLSLLQIHRKNKRTVKKVYKTTSDR